MWSTFTITCGRLNVALGCLLFSLFPDLFSCLPSLFFLIFSPDSRSHLQFQLWKIGVTPSLFKIFIVNENCCLIFCSINHPFYKRLKLLKIYGKKLARNDGQRLRVQTFDLSENIIVHPKRNRGPPQLGGASGIFLFRNGRFYCK